MLLSRFIAQQGGGVVGDPYAHVAFILTNVTRLQKGQEILLEPGRGYLDALVSQLNADSVLRRQGCSTALRNICFGAQVGPERHGFEHCSCIDADTSISNIAAVGPLLTSRLTGIVVSWKHTTWLSMTELANAGHQ